MILKAAEREFLSKGFAGARTTSIAEAAGVTHAMFHYYFRTKEKLFEKIITEKIALLKDALLGSLMDINAPLEEIIRNIISKHLDFIAANPDIPRFLICEIAGNPVRSSSFVDYISKVAPQLINNLQKKIDCDAAAGKCRQVDAKMLMLDIISLNVFAYIAAPLAMAAFADLMADPEIFLQQRKRENYDTIIRKLKP